MLKVILLSLLMSSCAPAYAQDRFNVIRIFTSTGILVYSGCDLEIRYRNVTASCTSMDIQRSIVGPTLSDHKMNLSILTDGKIHAYERARLISTSVDSRSATFDFDIRDKPKGK